MKRQLIALGTVAVMLGSFGNAGATMMQATWTAQIKNRAQRARFSNNP